MGGTVLIAEDDPVNRKLFTDLLRILGCAVLEAANGREAIELVRSHGPDLVLMDIQMPVMGGIEATQIIRADPKIARTCVVALTACVMAGDQERILAAGCDDFITKPVEIQEFRSRVAHWLGRKRNDVKK